MLGLRKWRHTAIDLFQGDITSFVCDGMVNAANSELIGGGGVDGAVHRVGGPDIATECRAIGHCLPGKAVLTTAGHLPCRAVIHAVGPIWQGGAVNEAETLAAAYRHSLLLAQQHELHHLAFSAISTGAYCYPASEAARIALKTVKETLEEGSVNRVRRITFVLFTGKLYQVFQKQLFDTFPENLLGEQGDH